MEKLSFYDVKARDKFETSDYVIKVKNNRRFAVAKSPGGTQAWRILGMA